MPHLSLIVTGASSGIGRATALIAAARGHRLVLTSRSLDKLSPVAQECEDAGAGGVTALEYDARCSDPGQIVQAVRTSQGRLVLVNNAGSARFGRFHEMTIQESASQVETMLIGTMRATHAFLPEMLSRGGGTVINVLSVAATHVFPHAEAYSAAKAGALAFSKSLGSSYEDEGIAVVGLIVGATDTPLWEAMDWSPAKEDMLKPGQVGTKIIELAETALPGGYREVSLLPPKGIL